MAPSDSPGPLNAAHAHAAKADDYSAQGLIVLAAEEHLKAADAFATCVEQASGENTKRTLRQLREKHQKAHAELEARIAKLREEGADPSLPQRPKPRPAGSYAPPAGTSAAMKNVMAPPTSPSPPPNGRQWQKMAESQAVGDESFMVLGARSQTDPGDAFNRFWKTMEGLEDRLSQPVAFATVPLDASHKPHMASSSSSSDTDVEANVMRRGKRGTPSKSVVSQSRAGISQFPPPRLQAQTFDLQGQLDEVLADDDDELAESFFLIPSSANTKPASASNSPLQQENATLKAELQAAQKQLAMQEQQLRKRADQDRELRASIVVAKQEAQRAMASSMVIQPPPRGQPNMGPPIGSVLPDLGTLPFMPGGLVGDQSKRVRELEEEVRFLKVENEKQKAMIARFRDKWEKLKESSRKKKSARAAADSDSVKETIEEAPEEEERAAALDGSGGTVVEVAA